MMAELAGRSGMFPRSNAGELVPALRGVLPGYSTEFHGGRPAAFGSFPAAGRARAW